MGMRWKSEENGGRKEEGGGEEARQGKRERPDGEATPQAASDAEPSG